MAMWRDAARIALYVFMLALVAEPVYARHHRPAEQAAPAQAVHVNTNVIVAFSPNGDATSVIVHAIDAARHEILVQAYGFTSKPILAALAGAEARGVTVKVILDKSNETARYSGATYVANHGVPVWIDGSVHIAHNKVMVFDEHSVLTGSFNFTNSAQRSNAENVVLFEDAPQLARLYVADWNWRRRFSEPYHRR